MAWLAGIDEAGYGPNLGPLVMTVVACQVPDDTPPDANLWKLLRRGVRRHGQRDDGRPVVADSKLVYSPNRGLSQLERTVLTALGIESRSPEDGTPTHALTSLVTRVAPRASADLLHEAWFSGNSAVPRECRQATLDIARSFLRGSCERAGVTPDFFCRSVIICTPRFNDLTDTRDSKGAVLSTGLVELLHAFLAETVAEPATLAVDKHGGRNRYADILRQAFPGATVQPGEEGMDRSVYAVDGLDRPVRVTVLPRADATHFPVALASMVSKYLREALMGEFNTFWQQHVPGLAPTAGYPEDAPRFLAAIRPAMAKLGVTERQVWRRK